MSEKKDVAAAVERLKKFVNTATLHTELGRRYNRVPILNHQRDIRTVLSRVSVLEEIVKIQSLAIQRIANSEPGYGAPIDACDHPDCSFCESMIDIARIAQRAAAEAARGQ